MIRKYGYVSYTVLMALALVFQTGCPTAGGGGGGGDPSDTNDNGTDNTTDNGTDNTDDNGTDNTNDNTGGALILTRTNQPVRPDGLLHASESGGIIAFEYRDADSNLTVGYWDIAAGAKGPDILIPGFDNTAGVSDPTKPTGSDFACLNGKILVSDGGFGQLALYDTSDASSEILDLPGTRTTTPQSRVAGDGGRYGAAIINGKLTEEFSEEDRSQVVAIDSDTNTVIEFGDAAATGEPRDDYRAVAVWGNEIAVLANIDATGTDTVMVFDVNDAGAAPQSFPSTMDLLLDSAAFDFDGTYVLLYNSDDNLVMLDTDTGEYSIAATNNVAKSTRTGEAVRSQESIAGGVYAYLGDGGFGATSLASVGTAGGATSTVADTDPGGHSPAGHGNTIAVTTSGRVFSAGGGDISTQGGNLSEVAGGAAVFITDLVGDALTDGFIAASDIFVSGNLVSFKTGLDGNNNASNDTVLSFFSAP